MAINTYRPNMSLRGQELETELMVVCAQRDAVEYVLGYPETLALQEE